MSSSTIPKIAIIGAGPVSLTLGNILQNNDIPFTLYESSSTFRVQGGSLDLHPQAGQRALKEAGLWDEFIKRARPESDCLKLVSIDGHVEWDENTTDKQESKGGDNMFEGRPEIDRAQLQEILDKNIKPEAIKFNKKFTEAVPNKADSKKYDLHFADGTVEEGIDLLIGGDGAWSKVRNLLTDIKPEYSGISMVELWSDVAKHPWTAEYVGAGSTFSFGEGIAVLAQRQSDGSVRSYAALRVPEDFLETCGIDWKEPETALKEFVNRYFNDIGADLKRVLLESTSNLIPRTLYELPVGTTWPARSGVTLIGDAAHLMTPFAGVGVNVGMADALLLAKEIQAVVSSEKSIDEAVQAYEQEMFPRSAKFAQKTAKNKNGHFSEGGSKEMADRLKAHYYGTTKTKDVTGEL